MIKKRGAKGMANNINSLNASLTPSQEIDEIINNTREWRDITLSDLCRIVKRSAPSIVEEVKWKKPSRPEGVPVWSVEGIICVADILKNAVRLTFPKGALLSDPKKLFNARLDSKTVRAVDFHQDDVIADSVLTAIVEEAIYLNKHKRRDNGNKK